MCAMALLSCSALVVVSWHGTTEAHFHYFVMVGALALYEEWWAYLMAIAFVVVQHGVISFWETGAVFDHDRRAWAWAGVHGLFVAALAVANLISWRANESARAATASSEERFRRAFDAAPVAMALVSPAGALLQTNEELRERIGVRRRALLGLRPRRRPRGAEGELAAGVRRAGGRAALRARRRQPRLVHLAPLADPRRRGPPGPLHLPGRRHHRPQAGRRAPRPPGPPRPADRAAQPRALRHDAGRRARAPPGEQHPPRGAVRRHRRLQGHQRLARPPRRRRAAGRGRRAADRGRPARATRSPASAATSS